MSYTTGRRERGGIGRRAGLRILSRKGCGFNSRRSHSRLLVRSPLHLLPFLPPLPRCLGTSIALTALSGRTSR